MNPIAGFGETTKYSSTKSTEQPQNENNYDNCPHDISPIV
jgi:hypothetical protein